MRQQLSKYRAVVLGIASLVPIGAAIGVLAEPPAPPIPTPEQTAFFETKVRPLIATKCYSCHGPAQQSADLRLDSRAAMLKGNAHGTVLIPGDPEKSSLVQVTHYDGKIKMPPAGKLSAVETAALAQWVKMGAPWTPDKPNSVPQNVVYKISDAQRNFWSFKPVKKPALPKVKNSAWCVTPIDRFVLAKLEEKGMKPAGAADRRSLIRRVTFDLVGLPPTPEEVEAFLTDKSANAWAKVVDRLLASPHYGEVWGRHWLDLVRYADSNGLDENVAFANAFRYRDYVVNAFNKDKPYTDFIKEQLAGDLMSSTDSALNNERITATGFLTLGPKVLAEPDKQKMVMDIVDEQIEVTSKAFLGLTVACARCHNHKFDPIPTKDYYALAGIFKSTKCMATLNTVAMWNERKLSSMHSETERIASEAKLKELEAVLNQKRNTANTALLANFRVDSGKYLLAGYELSRQPASGPVAELNKDLKSLRAQIIEAEKFVRSSGIAIDTENYGKGIGVLYNVGGGDSIEWEIEVPAAGDYQIDFRYASGESRPCKLSLNGKTIRGDATNLATGGFFTPHQKWDKQGIFAFRAGKNVLKIENNVNIPHFDKLAVTPALPSENGKTPQTPEQIAKQYGLNVLLLKHSSKLASQLKSDPSKLSAEALKSEQESFAKNLTLPEKPDEAYSDNDRKAVAKLQKEFDDRKMNPFTPEMAMAVEEGKIENCKVHIRGDTQTLGDEVSRHFLTILGGDSIIIDDKKSGRLELANWLARPEHPLTARVAVNRIWQGHFGVGLVKTPDNYGLLGQSPTHPELFDWLAATFSEGADGKKAPSPEACAWSFKKLHRLILLSNAYKQGTMPDAKTEAIASKNDTDNTLLWKYPRRRLEAEPFRDSLLAMSGKLDLTIGGSVLTTKNHDYVTNDQSGNAGQYDSPRRALYLPLIRNAMFDMFLAFDVGDPSMVNAKRATTTVAPQALFVMNSPFVEDQAKGFAETLLIQKNLTDAQRYNQACLRAFGRPANPTELARASAYLNAYGERLKSEPDVQARSLKAWISLCHILLSSNEFIYLN